MPAMSARESSVQLRAGLLCIEVIALSSLESANALFKPNGKA